MLALLIAATQQVFAPPGQRAVDLVRCCPFMIFVFFPDFAIVGRFMIEYNVTWAFFTLETVGEGL